MASAASPCNVAVACEQDAVSQPSTPPVEMFDSDEDKWFEARGWGMSAKVYGVVAKLAVTGRVVFSAGQFDLRGGPAVYLRKVRKAIANQNNIPRVSVKLLEPSEIEGTQVVVPVVLQSAWRYTLLCTGTREAVMRQLRAPRHGMDAET